MGARFIPEIPADIGLGNVLNKQQHIAHGFITQPTADPYFTGNTYTRPGAGSPYPIAIGGVPATISIDKSIPIDLLAEWLGMTQAQRYGQWFIWMDAAYGLNASKNPWLITDISVIPVDTAYCNDNGAGGYEWILARETHQADRNLIEHRDWHDAYGAKYINGLNSLTIGSGAAGNSVNTFSLAGGEISDEGLRSILTGAQTTGRIGYRSVTAMKFDAIGTAYIKMNGAVPRYDNAGTLTDIPVNKYGVVWVAATNRYAAGGKVALIMGQGIYDSVALAQAAAQPTLLGMSVAEWKYTHLIIIQNFANALKWIQNDPLYQKSTGPAIGGSSAATMPAGNITTTGGVYSNAQAYLDGLAFLTSGVIVLDGLDNGATPPLPGVVLQAQKEAYEALGKTVIWYSTGTETPTPSGTLTGVSVTTSVGELTGVGAGAGLGALTGVSVVTSVGELTGAVANQDLVWNSGDKYSTVVLTTSDQVAYGGEAAWRSVRSNVFKSTGLRYCEFVLSAGTSPVCAVGIANATASLATFIGAAGGNGVMWEFSGNKIYPTGSASGPATYTSGMRICMAWNASNGNVWFAKNGTPDIGAAAHGVLSGSVCPAASFSLNNSGVTIRIYDQPADWVHTPPTDYVSWGAA